MSVRAHNLLRPPPRKWKSWIPAPVNGHLKSTCIIIAFRYFFFFFMGEWIASCFSRPCRAKLIMNFACMQPGLVCCVGEVALFIQGGQKERNTYDQLFQENEGQNKQVCALLRIKFILQQQDDTKIINFDEGVLQRSVAIFLRQCHFQNLPLLSQKSQ